MNKNLVYINTASKRKRRSKSNYNFVNKPQINDTFSIQIMFIYIIENPWQGLLPPVEKNFISLLVFKELPLFLLNIVSFANSRMHIERFKKRDLTFDEKEKKSKNKR